MKLRKHEPRLGDEGVQLAAFGKHLDLLFDRELLLVQYGLPVQITSFELVFVGNGGRAVIKHIRHEVEMRSDHLRKTFRVRTSVDKT